jgi:PPOX class probable F420-dependent enzyme
MRREEIIGFLRKQRLGTVSTLGEGGAPQAAVVGLAFSDRGEAIFDVQSSTRKVKNLRRDPRAAIVVWEGERTVQLEGLADELSGAERDRLLAVYLQAFPEGLERAHRQGTLHIRVRPTWVRYSDFDARPPLTVELAWGFD